MSSIFTKIIQGKIPSYKVAEDDNYYAFLDINPVNAGHTLVVPKKEVDKLFDLDDTTYSGLFQFSKRVAAAIEKTLPCDRVGMTVVGLEVPHAHIHLIPINIMDDMNFFRAKRDLSQEALVNIAEDISANFI
jgi:histidine triad (HIT) family protein